MGFGLPGKSSEIFSATYARMQRVASDHVHFAAIAALAVNELAALFGPHAGAETDFADALAIRDFVGVMHR
jgi:hypothetical protein